MGNNMSLDDNVLLIAARLFAAPAIHLSEGDEQCV